MSKGLNIFDLGICPTGEHKDGKRCGYVGCLNLAAWADANRYRYQLEESYKAESDSHIKGDGRWFVEVLCRNGKIYPVGGTGLAALVKNGVLAQMREIPQVIEQGSDLKQRQFKFPAEKLELVSAILRPKRRGGNPNPDMTGLNRPQK